METFEEWLDREYPMPEHGRNYNKVKVFRKIWDYQQARIDELEKERSEIFWLLERSHKYLEDGKRQFAPNTTNSLVDDLLSDLKTKLNKNKES